MRQRDYEIIEAKRMLKKWLKPGKTVYTILRHVSNSGMSRCISLYTIHKGELIFLDGCVEKLLGYKRDRNHEGLRVSGCGMDMGFHLVYSLGRALFPKGFKTPKGYWRNEPLNYDPDGGYSLKHSWL